MTELLLPLLEKSQPYACVALTEKWAQKYGDKGIGFYAIHLGWVATDGVAMSLSSFSKSYVLVSSFNIHISFQLYYWFQFAGRCVCVCARSSIVLLR
ncbi:putative NAD(P)-binding domain superfamily [Helianthus annuus]|uniref:NAD(P)-binding domain superfamily n=1 Tax=Helianthus annuus TaxID=4232 RepID=A0A9K3E7N3_HELAN|nr:putative NAD(P)-binding domain superfamily [Helianthus annuus]KAJ0463184.1 putative NAD(P)-binding domain superfamily [Helianthus annuus]KAJ0467058.1 putative NAD(P)-binding domain superfamily [Helianthus annuus]KAJ0484556.1 putative NAD(P)-binding domain superfamily [Helianthus annuus]KAJ0655111.1 putative NAD(P)-binding domain superfamily [Helianthus annuus]